MLPFSPLEWNTHGLPVAQPAKTIGLLFVALPQLTEGYTYLESPVSERPTLQDAEDVVKKGVETVKDKAVGAKEKVKSGLSSVEDTIEKNIEPVKEKAADWIGHAEEVVSEKVSEFIQGANDTASKIESAITDKEKTVKDKIKSTVDDVKSKVKDVKSKVEDIKNAARERIHEATRPRKPEVVEHYAEPTGEPVEEPITVEPVVTITEPTVEPLPLEEEPVTVKEVPVHHTHQVRSHFCTN